MMPTARMSSKQAMTCARQQGGRLCVAESETGARHILTEAFAELGFASVAATRHDPDGVLHVLWHSTDGDPFSAQGSAGTGGRRVVARFDSAANRWTRNQGQPPSGSVLEVAGDDRPRSLRDLPDIFADLPWRTVLTVPHLVGDRSFSTSVASLAPFGTHSGSLKAVRFLTNLYFGLRTVNWGEPEHRTPGGARLSPKQIECLRWAAAGKTYRDIAEIVGVSLRTVRYHLENARTQYGFATITQTLVQAAKDLELDPMGEH
jgi:DNA-binding CsgD family transcriptional regulator